MSLDADWTLAGLIQEKDESYKAVLGGQGNKLQASEEFAAKAQQIYDHTAALPDGTLCFISNVKTLRQQTANILKAVGFDNDVLNAIAPLAEELHVRLQ